MSESDEEIFFVPRPAAGAAAVPVAQANQAAPAPAEDVPVAATSDEPSPDAPGGQSDGGPADGEADEGRPWLHYTSERLYAIRDEIPRSLVNRRPRGMDRIVERTMKSYQSGRLGGRSGRGGRRGADGAAAAGQQSPRRSGAPQDTNPRSQTSQSNPGSERERRREQAGSGQPEWASDAALEEESSASDMVFGEGEKELVPFFSSGGGGAAKPATPAASPAPPQTAAPAPAAAGFGVNVDALFAHSTDSGSATPSPSQGSRFSKFFSAESSPAPAAEAPKVSPVATAPKVPFGEEMSGQDFFGAFRAQNTSSRPGVAASAPPLSTAPPPGRGSVAGQHVGLTAFLSNIQAQGPVQGLRPMPQGARMANEIHGASPPMSAPPARRTATEAPARSFGRGSRLQANARPPAPARGPGPQGPQQIGLAHLFGQASGMGSAMPPLPGGAHVFSATALESRGVAPPMPQGARVMSLAEVEKR
jgi:hypothetical protein